MFSVLNDALPFNRIFTIGCYRGNPTVSKKIEQPGDLLSGGYGVDWCALIKTPRWEHREEKPGLFACPGGPARMKPFLTKFCGRTWKTIWCCAERFLRYPTNIFTDWWKIRFAGWRVKRNQNPPPPPKKKNTLWWRRGKETEQYGRLTRQLYPKPSIFPHRLYYWWIRSLFSKTFLPSLKTFLPSWETFLPFSENEHLCSEMLSDLRWDRAAGWFVCLVATALIDALWPKRRDGYTVKRSPGCLPVSEVRPARNHFNSCLFCGHTWGILWRCALRYPKKKNIF